MAIRPRSIRDFRAHLSAAPLKRGFVGRTIDTLRNFRARMSAAPLKLLLPILPHLCPAIFPRSNERGPVEAAHGLAATHC